MTMKVSLIGDYRLKVNVGSTVYNVKLQTTNSISKIVSEYREEPIECAGLCDYMKEEILVSKDFPGESRKKIMFHEITHAMLAEIGSTMNEDEYFVDALARQIYAFFKRNNVEKLQEFITK